MSCAGCNLLDDKQVVLLDGTIVCSSCELHRAECEARMVLSYPSTQHRREYLTEVERRRGKDAVDKLKLLITLLWERRKAGQPLHGKVA